MTDDRTLPPAARIDRLLRSSTVVWLGTVRPDGAPHLVPIWFSWNGEQLFIASKPNAVKVRNLRADGRVMVALGEPDDDFDVGLVEGVAELPVSSTADLLPRGHLAKYVDQLAALGLDADAYAETYCQPILIRPTRYLPWHGRTVPASAMAGPAADSAPGRGDSRPGPLGRLADALGGLLRRRNLAPLGLGG